METPYMLEIIDYEARYAADFRDINLEWIEEMFTVEEIDRQILCDPQTHILDGGGHIKVALLNGRAVGVAAAMQTAPGHFELTKMGVLPEARGHSVGTKLLQAIVDRARALGAQELYLLSSHKCQVAVRLYEKFGFRHDLDVMARYGGNYSRCDVAMSYPLPVQETE